MELKASTLLKRLEHLKTAYGNDAAGQKLELLCSLERRRLQKAAEVYRLHETLSFLHAYPDSKPIHHQVEKMLAGFSQRADLMRFRRALADTGITGTTIYYSFFSPTAQWIVKRFPDCLTIDWADFDNKDKLVELLPFLLPFSESYALEMLSYTAQEWLDRLKGNRETDAAFVVRRFATYGAGSVTREKLYDELDIPMRLAPGRGTPTRTNVKFPGSSEVFHDRPLSRVRPDLRQEMLRPPLRVRTLSPREGQRLIDMAVETMITHARDLDAFAYGDKNSVRLVDCGQGLQFATMGMLPERRYLLEAVYGFLALKNGVPLGYVGAVSLFNSAEINYNVFETFRGAEAAHIFGRALAVAHHLFGAATISIDPYQLGHDNTEGLQSGAWWFYYKLGFRPERSDVRRLLRSEIRRLRTNPRYRSTVLTLQRLSSAPMFLYLHRTKQDVLSKMSLGEVGLKISRLLADRFGADREDGIRTSSRETARLLGVRSQRSWSASQRQWWDRWSPIILTLPRVTHWKAAEKRALVEVARAKGGRHESNYLTLFNKHRRLRRAILKLTDEPS
jgi:hypothetical protein